jgi:aryl-alcohol dehydrogenase-like predicted oxidoreductase
MDYKLLGQSGLRVSEMFLGTMTFGEDWGWGGSWLGRPPPWRPEVLCSGQVGDEDKAWVLQA